ncbi:Hypothetical protein SMAX5B_001807 [Scophthalmus maximus]|uniref:Uncharacterized protein n=1 Tax=Scophthalmus maximus TaxID=52904 RepID=A0A2U9CVS9_SCOMX|nr:Hypothetical protein SMAX5B_001807 [Scophthalmus maximus]
MENQTCVVQNLSKIEQMQTRLRSNLEAIGMLNQQESTNHQRRDESKVLLSPLSSPKLQGLGNGSPDFC